MHVARIQLWLALALASFGTSSIPTAANPAFAFRTESKGPRIEVQTGHLTPVTRLAFSPDGESLASSDSNGFVIIWNLASGTSRLTVNSALVKKTPGHSSLYFGDKWIASVAYSDQLLQVASVRDGSVIQTAGGQPIKRIVVDSTASSLVSLTAAGEIVLMDTNTWQHIASSKGQKCSIDHADALGDAYGNSDFILLPDERGLMTVNARAEVTIFGADDGCVRERVHLQSVDAYSAVAISPRDNYVAASNYKTVAIWKWVTSTHRFRLIEASDALRQIVFSPDEKYLLLGFISGEVRVMDIETNDTQSWRFDDDVMSIAFRPDGRKIAVGLLTGKIKLISLDQDDLIEELASPVLRPVGLTRGADGQTMQVRTETEVIRLDLRQGSFPTVVRRADGDDRVEMSSDGSRIWSVSNDGGGTLWNAASGREPQRISEMIPIGSWVSVPDPSGDNFALSYGNEVRLYDVESGTFEVAGRLGHPATALDYSRWQMAGCSWLR